jgi:SAM-dependent methyltransferase
MPVSTPENVQDRLARYEECWRLSETGSPEAVGAHAGYANVRYTLAAAVIEGVDEVLDVGCGLGHLRAYLPPATRYVGMDLADFYLRDARRLNPGTLFLRADILAAPFRAQSVAAVVAVVPFSWWPLRDAVQAVRAMARLARDRFVLIDNNFSHSEETQDFRDGFPDGTHVYMNPECETDLYVWRAA